MSRMAVFLDRDGTINSDPGYLRAPEQLRLFPTAAAAVAALNRRGLLVILVTNQGGIARGYLTEADFLQVQERLTVELALAGAWLDAVYYCPHHPEGTVEPYGVVCTCRKPAPGMLLQAAAAFDVDLAHSYMIGDKPSDILAGKAAGCRTILVGPAAGAQAGAAAGAQAGAPPAAPDFVADDLYGAVQWLLSDLGARGRGSPRP